MASGNEEKRLLLPHVYVTHFLIPYVRFPILRCNLSSNHIVLNSTIFDSLRISNTVRVVSAVESMLLYFLKSSTPKILL